MSAAALFASRRGTLRGQRTWARTQISMHENREVPRLPEGVGWWPSWIDGCWSGLCGSRGERFGGKPSMNDRGKSDGPVVPVKLPNKPAVVAGAEVVEGRGSAKGSTAGQTRPGRSAGQGVSSELDRVRQMARRDKEVRFTALLHHVTIDCLREAYRAISPAAAAGVDGVTWRDYGRDLEANLSGLHARVHRGAFRAKPTRRVFISKPDGRLRPLGVAALEDKIVQRALVRVLNAVYEEDFLGFSYGFRPGRSAHDALDALAVAITASTGQL